MNKTLKILSILLIAITLITFSTSVFAVPEATDSQPINPSNLTATYGNSTELQSKAGKIMGMIRNIAVIVAVIVLMVLGVKYMLGGVEEKADYKKSFIPVVVGIILVVAATSVAAFIFNMVE